MKGDAVSRPAQPSGLASRLGLFEDPAHLADAIDQLHALGIPDEGMLVMTGVPFPEQSLGRHREWLALPSVVLGGAAAGFLFGVFLAVITPHLYRLDIGGHPPVGFAPAGVIIFVFTMMAIIVSTFLGVVWEMNFPRFGPAPYHRRVTDGALAVLLEFPVGLEGRVREIVEANHVQHFAEPEWMDV